MSARSFKLTSKNSSQSNITINYEGDIGRIFLFGHHIIKFDSNSVVLNSCGWRTDSTRNAINRFFQQKGLNYKLWTKRGVWVLDCPNYTTIEFKDLMRLSI